MRELGRGAVARSAIFATIIFSAPAAAQDLGRFVGKWTDAAGGLRYCSTNFDGYIIGRNTLQNIDSRCRVRNVRKDGNVYRAGLSCDVEGSSSNTTATFKTVSPDRILIGGKEYLRCK